MQIQILMFLENLIPVQRVLLGQRSAFFFHSPFPCTFIPINQSASQSVTRNNTSSGTVLLHINRIHKSREPITNIPSIQRWGGQGGLEESRSSTRKLCTADSAGTEHNAYAPMSAFSLSLSPSMGLTNQQPSPIPSEVVVMWPSATDHDADDYVKLLTLYFDFCINCRHPTNEPPTTAALALRRELLSRYNVL